MYLLAGPIGLAISAVVALATTLCPLMFRSLRRRQMAVVAVALLMIVATIGLAAGPWRSSLGYNGWDWWVQLPALLAVVLVAWRAIRVPHWLIRANLRRRG